MPAPVPWPFGTKRSVNSAVPAYRIEVSRSFFMSETAKQPRLSQLSEFVFPQKQHHHKFSKLSSSTNVFRFDSVRYIAMISYLGVRF